MNQYHEGKVKRTPIPLFTKIVKYIDLFNHHLSEQIQGGFYLEVVEGGLIYIYDGITAFKKINRQFSPQLIKSFLETHDPILPPEALLNGVLDRANFPKDGVIVNFIAQTEPKDQYLFLKEAHFRSYLTTGVSIDTKSPDDLILTFHTYEALLNYSKFLVALISGLLPYQKIFTDQKQNVHEI